MRSVEPGVELTSAVPLMTLYVTQTLSDCRFSSRRWATRAEALERRERLKDAGS